MKDYNISKEDVCVVMSGFYNTSGYWVESLDYNYTVYEAVKEELAAKIGKDHDENITEPFFEDVLTEMLYRGEEFIIVDDEDEVHYLTLDKLLDGIMVGITEYRLGVDSYDWDGVACDMMVQLAIYGEVVYG